MTTVEDKLKLFAKIIFEKVENDSAKRVADSTREYDALLEKEKKSILKESDMIILQARKKTESKKNQTISKANMDYQHALLKKRKELYDRMVNDIKKLADQFAKGPEYSSYLEKSIKGGLSKMDASEVVIFLNHYDIENHMDTIKKSIERYRKLGMTVYVQETERNIIGGCICEDKDSIVRVDCSMSTVIEDNRVLIGKVLMDNLQ